jgi:protein subunit release factor A
MVTRKPALSITIADCRVDTFTVGGHGGAGKDTSNTGVRVVHEPSGAVGQAVDSRKQSENKRLAFRRMASKPELIRWIHQQIKDARTKSTLEERVNAAVDEQMNPDNLRIEAYEDSKWVVIK